MREIQDRLAGPQAPPAGAPNLGRVLSEHAQGAVSRALGQALRWALVGAGGLAVAGGGALLVFALGWGGNDAVLTAFGGLALMYFGGIAVFGGAWDLARLRRCRGARRLVCEGGLIDFREGVTNQATWDEITSYELVGEENDSRLVLFCRGRSFTLRNDVGDFREVLAALDGQTSERLWREAIEVIEAGEAACFGGLRLSKRGLSKGGPGTGHPVENLPWEEVRDITWSDATAVIRSRSAFFVPWFMGNMPNHPVCAALLERGQAGRLGDRASRPGAESRCR